MILAARKAGVTLVTADCYRDYAGQVYWRTWWCNVGKCGNAAVPGTSNHGWGKAIDFHDLSGGLPTNGAAYRWLKANAGRFGWNNPILTNEAWHWEWVGDGGTMGGYTGPPGPVHLPADPGHDQQRRGQAAAAEPARPRLLAGPGRQLRADHHHLRQAVPAAQRPDPGRRRRQRHRLGDASVQLIRPAGIRRPATREAPSAAAEGASRRSA